MPRFAWDPDKAAENLRKHRVDFEDAKGVFDDLYAIEDVDPDPDEERWKRIGRAGNAILVVVYTERPGGVIRLISARKAKANERQAYQEGGL